MLMCFRPSLTSVVERNIKEENELFQWRTELVAIFKGRKEPLSSAEVGCGIIGFALREVSAGATKILTKQKTGAECHFYYQLELMQRLILSNDLFQKMFLIFTPQARKV